MARLGLWIAALALLFCAAACTKQTQSNPAPSSSKAIASFRVAMLLPRSIDSDGWTRSGYQGLLLIEKQLGASIAYTENVPEAEFEKAYEGFASQGFDFILGHGGQFVAAAQKAAARFPRTYFAVVGAYGGNNANLGGIAMREGEMGYLFGVIAAIKTKTKRIAYLGGEENPTNAEITNSFESGALATDPTIKYRIDWVGNFTDAVKAEEIAAAQIKSGVDVIFVLAGAAGTGVHAQAERAGIHTLAWIEDMSKLAPKAVITSNVQNVPAMLLQGATLAKEGRWEGKQYRFGLAEGVQSLAPFNGLATEEEARRIESARKDILTGKIDTARSPRS